jgi:hypothetical protein
VTGESRVLLGDVANAGEDRQGWYRVSRAILPGSWVLVEPWGEAATTSTMGGHLLEVASGDVIELPPGTVGAG